MQTQGSDISSGHLFSSWAAIMLLPLLPQYKLMMLKLLPLPLYTSAAKNITSNRLNIYDFLCYKNCIMTKYDTTLEGSVAGLFLNNKPFGIFFSNYLWIKDLCYVEYVN